MKQRLFYDNYYKKTAVLVPEYSYEEIGEISYDFLRELHHESTIPVPIEKILDNDLRINICPIPGLRDYFEVEGWISSDLTTIHVDDFICNKRECRYRFTLAHELGHAVLHKKIYSEYHFNKIDEWKDFCIHVDNGIYSWLETQARFFAELILVPKILLREKFIESLKNLDSSFELASYLELKKDEYLDYVLDLLSTNLAQVFHVAIRVVHRRIERDKLMPLIPGYAEEIMPDNESIILEPSEDNLNEFVEEHAENIFEDDIRNLKLLKSIPKADLKDAANFFKEKIHSK